MISGARGCAEDNLAQQASTGVIVLAQASMGHLAEILQDIAGVPVLKSPPLAIAALVEKVKS